MLAPPVPVQPRRRVVAVSQHLLLAVDHARGAIPHRQHQIERRRDHLQRGLDRTTQLQVRLGPRHGAQCTFPPRAIACGFGARAGVATIGRMEGSGFGGLFGDPDELQRRLGEFAEQMQGAQRLAWADNAIKLAVDLTVAAMNRANIQGTTEQQAEQLRAVMATIFPEAVTLVREAREGLQ
jgi:hypothetical protein